MDKLPFDIPDDVDVQLELPQGVPDSPINRRLQDLYQKVALRINCCLVSVRDYYSRDSRIVVSQIRCIDGTRKIMEQMSGVMSQVLQRYGTEGIFVLPQAHREALALLEISWPVAVPAAPVADPAAPSADPAAPAVDPPAPAVDPAAPAVDPPAAPVADPVPAAPVADPPAPVADPPAPAVRAWAAPAPLAVPARAAPAPRAITPRAITPRAAVPARAAPAPRAIAPRADPALAAVVAAAALRRRRRRRGLCRGYGLYVAIVATAAVMTWVLFA